MPPKPARTGRKQYSWQNPPKKDICMHIRIINPWECRKAKKEMTFKSQGSINCPHKTIDEVASSNSDVTGKAVCAPAVLSVERLSSLVARKRFLPTEYLALSLIDNFRKRWMAISYSPYNDIRHIRRNNGNITMRRKKTHRQLNGMCV